MNVVLISTYELGRQPFGLASPAAWLRQAGARVKCLDLSVQRLDEAAVRDADLVAFYLPMHTATRIASQVVPRVRALNPLTHLCFYGLYASMNEAFLRNLGAHTVLGGEFEAGLLRLVERLRGGGHTSGEQVEPVLSLARQRFRVPDRSDLEGLSSYAQLILGGGRTCTVGYTEASRGCKHHCRHCPIVPVYNGTFRIVQRDVVLEDIRQQVGQGAEHITFGDPDFFNGIGHSLAVVRSLHDEFPHLSYDVTIKVEHLLRHAEHLMTLRRTGCLFVTTAVESIDDDVLGYLDKGHTRADFLRLVDLCRDVGLDLNPTFVPFHPWTSLAGYQELLLLLAELDLVDHVSPIQLAIRLLIPAGSRLLELPQVREIVGPFDEEALVYPWRHTEPCVDRLQSEVEALVREATNGGETRRGIFFRIWELAENARGGSLPPPSLLAAPPPRAAIPYLNEPWYC